MLLCVIFSIEFVVNLFSFLNEFENNVDIKFVDIKLIFKKLVIVNSVKVLLKFDVLGSN